ncbi:putative PIN family toxin of toxin-antitoxin system [Desulfohalotomaculum tongense]|uniref:putative toxin-antitoxin system toxin component, PIN family n=1 Tax=Desulforadius tongensis TaxID=1216062 RepID=UPI0019594393|nr:putative toxin-antitoxin system toxin component, PIN family [Desulforadius tongensis]MBM7855103.1 putative PIN family toxin of toxin-antitoxin system [Desulforadius tongensis]
MKVVIDTNVLISGLISSKSHPAQILDLWMSNCIIVCITAEIVEEYISVLLRPKFKGIGSPQERYEIISGLVELEHTSVVNPDFRIKAIVEDPDDNIFLECALEAKAEVIISGDEHLLNLKEFEGIKILKPIEFLSKFC